MEERSVVALVRALQPAAQRDFLRSEEFQALSAEVKERFFAVVPELAEEARRSGPAASTEWPGESAEL
ncbi:hypothetical protein AB0K18_42580 [Nonomuraea sp. NPDC049421]|uniref:hypothetical protein n=1 Tax=Nonomuraea sp. NPDC049421 TaxID=3155275 RepID=UPI00343C628F